MGEKSVTTVTPVEFLEINIRHVNWIAELPVEQHGSPDIAPVIRNFCRTFHQIAHVIALPADMRADYAKAVVGTDEEWKKFCERLPAPLWRGWTDTDPMPAAWDKPRISFGLDITEDGIKPDAHDILQILVDVGADIRRMRECRVCQKLFWAKRIEKTGGPFGCSVRCNNVHRQRDFKASKKP
jgi:hypothetical protein